jgi:pimeloyl-ACP methyl ester carboxylesterase
MWRRCVVTMIMGASILVGTPAEASLSWMPCETKALRGFDCASFAVPKDYADASAGTFSLAVVRLRATGKKTGTLFFNPGGPGVASLPIAPSLAAALPKKIRTHFDFVTWDPRGVGRSAGLNECAPGEYSLPATGPVDWDQVMQDMRTSAAASNSACAARYPDVVPYISTNATVRDLDGLRAAVGDKLLTYWGTSYGTRIGYVYAHTFPDKVRAMLLSSSIDPDATWPDFLFGSATASDTALGLPFEAYPSAVSDYRKSIRRLNQRPLDLPSGQFTRWHVGMVLSGGAASDSNYKDLAGFLQTVRQATDGSKKARKALNAMGPWPRMLPINTGATAFIGCSDYAQRMTAEEQDQMARRVRATAPLVGYGATQGLVYCEGVDVTPNPVPVGFTNWRTPMLIMGSTRDALTPYGWTSDMARIFRNSRVVTLVGGTHTPYLGAGSKCVDKWGTRYLVDLKRPKVDVACPAVLP